MILANDPVIHRLDQAARSPIIARAVRSILDRVTQTLLGGTELMAWDTVPLTGVSSLLPKEIASCWVFVIRPGAATTAERHPNSHQRSFSLKGQGTFHLFTQRRWQDRPLSSSPGDDLASRWVSIPPSTWHRLSVGSEPWGMLSFHTVRAAELIEEKPVTLDHLNGETIQHRYQE